MRGKKIIFLSLLLITSVSSDVTPNKSTLTTFKIQSSKVLPNFQGEDHVSNPFKYVIPLFKSYRIQHNLIKDKSFTIRQINETSFEVLGSPLEWEVER
jgi:hypothetical protein